MMMRMTKDLNRCMFKTLSVGSVDSVAIDDEE
jgi:hypothetical protein